MKRLHFQPDPNQITAGGNLGVKGLLSACCGVSPRSAMGHHTPVPATLLIQVWVDSCRQMGSGSGPLPWPNLSIPTHTAAIPMPLHHIYLVCQASLVQWALTGRLCINTSVPTSSSVTEHLMALFQQTASRMQVLPVQQFIRSKPVFSKLFGRICNATSVGRGGMAVTRTPGSFHHQEQNSFFLKLT